MVKNVDQMWNLPVAFYFMVKIGANEYPFKEVNGLTSELEVETIYEGGENRFPLHLPKAKKTTIISLKSALLPFKIEDENWIKSILTDGFTTRIKTKDILVQLLNSDSKPIYQWHCHNVYPIKMELSALDAEKNEILMQTLEFACSHITISN